MPVRLGSLVPGWRFAVPELGLSGLLLKANECRAVVRLDRPVETVEFTDPDGQRREFVRRRSHETCWSPGTMVVPLKREEMEMSKKNGTPGPAKKLSQIDAALKVLAEQSTAMTCKQMVEAMSSKGYWTSPGGATPHATLYSAILREIQKKGSEARFAKAEKGFTLAGTVVPVEKPAAEPKPAKPEKSKADKPAKPKAAKKTKPAPVSA